MFGTIGKRQYLNMIARLEDHIERLEKQNEALFEKVMARDFSELKLFQVPEGTEVSEPLRPEEDLDNAGEFLALEQAT